MHETLRADRHPNRHARDSNESTAGTPDRGGVARCHPATRRECWRFARADHANGVSGRSRAGLPVVDPRASDLKPSRRTPMSANNHYDVIIIGSGAGGGTLAHRLAPSGQAHPAPGARRLRPAREGQLGFRAPSTSRGSYNTKEVWRDSGRQAAPSAHQLLRRRQHQVLRRGAVPPAQGRTSANSGTTAASRRRGRSPTTSSSRTTPRPSASTTCMASAAKIPTEPPASGALSASRRQPRAAHPAARGRLRAARVCSRSTCRSASARREERPRRAPASAATPATAFPAWSTPRPTPRCCASTRRWSTRTSRC